MHLYQCVCRFEDVPNVSANADQSGGAPTPDRPALELSTQVRVLGSEEGTPRNDPS